MRVTLLICIIVLVGACVCSDSEEAEVSKTGSEKTTRGSIRGISKSAAKVGIKLPVVTRTGSSSSDSSSSSYESSTTTSKVVVATPWDSSSEYIHACNARCSLAFGYVYITDELTEKPKYKDGVVFPACRGKVLPPPKVPPSQRGAGNTPPLDFDCDCLLTDEFRNHLKDIGLDEKKYQRLMNPLRPKPANAYLEAGMEKQNEINDGPPFILHLTNGQVVKMIRRQMAFEKPELEFQDDSTFDQYDFGLEEGDPRVN